jgi:hypothetical protein
VTDPGGSRRPIRWLAFGAAALVLAFVAGYAILAFTPSDAPRPGRAPVGHAERVGRHVRVDAFPDATFTLTTPITFDEAPERGESVDVSATGDLTLHGVTKSVTIPLQARWNGATIQVVGSLDIAFAEYGITAPSFADFVSVQDHGTIELSLVFGRA